MAAPVIKLHKNLVGADLHVNKLHAATHNAGGTDPMRWIHTQIVSLSTWTITHNLVAYPSVTVVDSGGNTVIGQVTYLSANALQIVFNASFSGKAYLS
jgi:hypothetical protein